MSHRTKMFLKAYFTGIVQDIPRRTLKKMRRDWRELKDKESFLQAIKQQSASRRQSMFETATRSNYLLVVAAFVIAANIAMIVAPGGSTASVVLLQISTSMIALAAAILAIAISAKSKAMKKPRRGGEIEPAEMLLKTIKIEKRTKADSGIKLWKEFVRESNRLHKRKIVLVVERRAQWGAAMLIAIGLLVMIAGICTH